MSPPVVDSYVIDSLRRKARTVRLQACRASPLLEGQSKSLAELLEADAERMASLRERAIRFWTQRRGMARGSADITLDRLLVTNARVIGTHPEFPLRPPLAKQIPALIQHDLEAPKPLAIGIGGGSV